MPSAVIGEYDLNIVYLESNDNVFIISIGNIASFSKYISSSVVSNYAKLLLRLNSRVKQNAKNITSPTTHSYNPRSIESGTYGLCKNECTFS